MSGLKILDISSEMLSEETIELCGSDSEDDFLCHKPIPDLPSFTINSTSEHLSERDLRKTVMNTRKTAPSEKSLSGDSICGLSDNVQLTISESSENSKVISNLSDEDLVTTPEKSSLFSNSQSLNHLSFEQRELPSEEKTVEFRVLLDKVNDAYVYWRTSEFLVDTIKTKSSAWVQQIKKISETSEKQQKVCIKSRNGEVFNLLGLEEDGTKYLTSRSLPFFNKSAFSEHAKEVVKANVFKLKSQKKSLQGVVSKEREEQRLLQRQLDDQKAQADQLLNSSRAKAQQLVTLRHNSAWDLQVATFTLLRDKATFLRTATSALKERVDQKMYLHENTMKAMNRLGDSLKATVSEKSEQLKILQKTLMEYEKKEAASEKYKEIITECAKLKKQLQHKYQTLNVLNDPDTSF